LPFFYFLSLIIIEYYDIYSRKGISLMSQQSSLYRTIQILRELNEGKKLCIESLALYYEVNERTIQRDFKLIREIFGDFMTKEGRCYQGHKKVLLDELLHATDLMTLANIINLFGITNKQSLISVKTDSMIKNSMSVYEFKSKPFEVIKNRELMQTLEHAIKFNKELNISYQAKNIIVNRLFQPYRILFLNENFYLVGWNITKNYFEYLRIALIKEFGTTSKSFYRDSETVAFIDSIQTPWAKFGVPQQRVRLHIQAHVAKYFLLKKYLPSQTITKEYENGELEVEYRVNDFKEVEELIIKWLPHLKVLEPVALNQQIKKVLLEKLKGT